MERAGFQPVRLQHICGGQKAHAQGGCPVCHRGWRISCVRAPPSCKPGSGPPLRLCVARRTRPHAPGRSAHPTPLGRVSSPGTIRFTATRSLPPCAAITSPTAQCAWQVGGVAPEGSSMGLLRCRQACSLQFAPWVRSAAFHLLVGSPMPAAFCPCVARPAACRQSGDTQRGAVRHR